MTYDYLIIGQGIAGTTLALQLMERGKRVFVLNKESMNSSSMIAAGIVNPVTGRRFVKSWMFDEVFSFAENFYKNWEDAFDKKIFKPTFINRAIFSHEEHHDFLAKTELSAYANYLSEDSNFELKEDFNKAVAWIKIKAARIKIKAYIERSRSYFLEQGSYRNEIFNHTALKREKEIWHYKDLQARSVVFCEGFQIKSNPFFNALPFVPAKGEILIAHIPHLTADRIYKHQCFIVPFGFNHTFWIGSTYQWDFKNEDASSEKKEELIQKLKQSINLDFTITDHLAAIRPTGKDRRPYIGRHQDEKNIFIFNALGTKGASLAPYWASHLIDHMEDGQELDKEVDVIRFF